MRIDVRDRGGGGAHRSVMPCTYRAWHDRRVSRPRTVTPELPAEIGMLRRPRLLAVAAESARRRAASSSSTAPARARRATTTLPAPQSRRPRGDRVRPARPRRERRTDGRPRARRRRRDRGRCCDPGWAATTRRRRSRCAGSSMGGYLALICGRGRGRRAPSSRSAPPAARACDGVLPTARFTFDADPPALDAVSRRTRRRRRCERARGPGPAAPRRGRRAGPGRSTHASWPRCCTRPGAD